MSLFLAGFWIPSSIQFGRTFLDTGLNFVDSLGAALICTLFSGIQLCMCRRILTLQLRLVENKQRPKMQYIQGMLITIASIILTVLFISAALIYNIQFSRNVLALRSIGRPPSLNGGGVAAFVRTCSSQSPGTVCFEVALERLHMARKMELVFSGLAQALLIVTDMLLILRCYFIFTDKPYVYISAALAFLGSLGVSLFGLISLAKTGGLSVESSWNWTRFNAESRLSQLPPGFSSSMSIISSLAVNAVVTILIVSRMLAARRRFHDSLPILHGGKDDVYTFAAVLLIESALPPVIFGIAASIFASTAVQNGRFAFEFNLIPKVAWLAFTALAPQLILVRILQGRAWGATRTFLADNHSTHASMPITFGPTNDDEEKRNSYDSDTAGNGGIALRVKIAEPEIVHDRRH